MSSPWSHTRQPLCTSSTMLGYTMPVKREPTDPRPAPARVLLASLALALCGAALLLTPLPAHLWAAPTTPAAPLAAVRFAGRPPTDRPVSLGRPTAVWSATAPAADPEVPTAAPSGSAARPLALRCSLGLGLLATAAAAAVTLRGTLRRGAAPLSPDRFAIATVSAEVVARDDDVLPDGPEDAVARASQSTVLAIREGKSRCIAEVNLDKVLDVISGPQFSEPGAAERWLKLNRDFVELFAADGKYKVAAVFSDKLIASVMQREYPQSSFVTLILSATTKADIIAAGATAVVFPAPDADSLDRICTLLDDLDPGFPVVLFNPRVGDFNVRKGQSGRQLTERFVTTYSMRYIRDAGAIFQCYPDPWKVFRDDPQVPGRYVLATTVDRRPAVWELDYLMSSQNADGAAPTLEVKDEAEGSAVVGYGLLYGLSIVPLLIGALVVYVLYTNSFQ
eukprot:EG_transcript_9126